MATEEEHETVVKLLAECLPWISYTILLFDTSSSEVRDFAEPERLVNGPTA